MPLFGYGLGYTAASLFNLPDASRRTVGEDFFSVFFEEFIRKLLKEVENFPPMDAILFPGRLRPGKRIASVGRRLCIILCMKILHAQFLLLERSLLVFVKI